MTKHIVTLPADLIEEVMDWATKLVARYRSGDPLQAMPWTRDQMSDDQLRAFLASRKEAASKIDIETCEIGCWYANANGDPYEIRSMLAEEDHLDKGYSDRFNFVRSPDSGGWICEGDLPKEKGIALYDRIHRERERERKQAG